MTMQVVLHALQNNPVVHAENRYAYADVVTCTYGRAGSLCRYSRMHGCLEEQVVNPTANARIGLMSASIILL
jgi:hypothetical protein